MKHHFLGSLLLEELQARGLDSSWLSELLGCTRERAAAILLGEQEITDDECGQLGYALGTSAALWKRLRDRS